MLKFQIPLGDFGDPVDIAEAAVFLLSKNAKYISGTTLNVNGGLFNWENFTVEKWSFH